MNIKEYNAEMLKQEVIKELQKMDHLDVPADILDGQIQRVSALLESDTKLSDIVAEAVECVVKLSIQRAMGGGV